MEQKLIIKGGLAATNEIINKNRTHYHAGAKQKKHNTNIVYYECLAQKLKPFTKQMDCVKYVEQGENRYIIYLVETVEDVKRKEKSV